MERAGMYRARLSFGDPITFGLFFAMVIPLTAPIWMYVERRRLWAVPAMGAATLGLLATLSSGPYVTLAFSVGILAFFKYRRYWRSVMAVIIVLIAFVEIYSNRHFYYVAASYAGFDERNAYGRIWLIEEALTTGMTGHWLTGYGLIGRAGPRRLNWANEDLANQYILVLARYGLVGLVPFLVMVGAAFGRLRLAMKLAPDERTRKLPWSLIAALAGTCLCFLDVALFGQPSIFFYLLLGMVGVLPTIVPSVRAIASSSNDRHG